MGDTCRDVSRTGEPGCCLGPADARDFDPIDRTWTSAAGRWLVCWLLAALLGGCGRPPPRTGRIQAPAPQPVTALRLPPLQRFRLANGLTVLLLPDHQIPLARVHLTLATGSIDDPPDRAGLAELTLRMLRRGAGDLDADALDELAETNGLRLHADADYELSDVGCLGRSRHVALCLELVAKMITKPAFAAAEADELRRQMIAEAQESHDDPALLAALHFDNLLMGDDHPVGRCASEASLTRVTRDDLIAFHRQRLVPGAAVLAVSGDIDPGRVRAQLTRLLGPWPARDRPARRVPAVPPPRRGLRLLLVDKPDLTQSFFVLGHLGIRRDDPRRDAVRTLNYVLSRLRLSRAVRSRAGKTYSIRSRFDTATDDGSFVVKSFTRNDQLVQTLGLVRAELRRIRREPPGPAEIRAAKGHLAGGCAIRFSTPGKLAAALMQAVHFGLPESHVTELGPRIQRLTPQQIAAAAALVQPDKMVGVIVGPARAIAAPLRAAGYTFERIAYQAPISARARRKPAREPIPAVEQARAKEVLARAAKAAGGRARLARIARVRIAGRVRIAPDVSFASPPLSGTYRLALEPPDGLRLTMSLAAEGTPLSMTTTQVLAGKTGHIETPRGRLHLDADQLRRLRGALWRQPVLVLHHALAVPSRPVRPAGLPPTRVAVELFPPGHPATTLVLDAGTHRLLEIRYRDDAGRMRTTELADHRVVQGVLVPHRSVTRRGRRVQTLEVERVTLE